MDETFLPKHLGCFTHRLDIEVLDEEGVVFNELPSLFDLIAHQDTEDFIGFNGVFNLHLEKRPRFWIHGGLPELFRVHLSQPLISLNPESLFPHLV